MKMGNSDSSTPSYLGFYNCSSVNASIISPSNGTQNAPAFDYNCGQVSFPFAIGNYTITIPSNTYTLLGTGMTTYGYSLVHIWESITLASSMDDSQFCDASGKCYSGKTINNNSGLNISFNSQIAVNVLGETALQIPFSDVLTASIQNIPPPVGGNGGNVYVSQGATSSAPKTPSSTNYWVILLIIIIVVAIAIAIIWVVHKKLTPQPQTPEPRAAVDTVTA